MILCQIWVFADMRGIPAMGSTAIDMLHEFSSAHWRPFGRKVLKYTYENTTPGSKLPMFMVDSYTKMYMYRKFETWFVVNPVTIDFLVDSMPILVRQGENFEGIGRQQWTEMDRCQWHNHSGPGGKLRLESRK
jgi:hypothetical protein